MTPFTFYFHDYETFGINPALDRPSQFAGVRTDSDLNIIDEPKTIYCKPANDYLPDPTAVLITGITPQHCFLNGLCEADFAKSIHESFSQENTCIVGYNNIRFDDEVTRNIFYRNFFDPYEYSYKNNNSRWDIIDVVRACYALRPEGINWPTNESGSVSFKLEHLTKANNIDHFAAHDAMSDVYATIEIAKLIKNKQPKLFNYFFNMRHKKKVAELINLSSFTPLVHVSGMFGASRSNASVIVPLMWQIDNQNAIITYDLTVNPMDLINLDAEVLKERLYTKTADLNENEQRIAIKSVHINKCPIIAPINTLTAEAAKRLNIDLDACNKHLELIKQNIAVIRSKLDVIFKRESNEIFNKDVDAQIYQGFYQDDDKYICKKIREADVYELAELKIAAIDERIEKLLFRYKARNYPESLTQHEALLWQDYWLKKLSPDVFQNYLITLNELAIKYKSEPDKLKLLKSLSNYCQYLIA